MEEKIKAGQCHPTLTEIAEIDLRTLVDKNVDGILIVDKDGFVRYINPAAETLFDRRKEEFIDQLFGFPVAAGDIDVIRQDQKTVSVEMHVAQIKWEGQMAYLASLRDITERKQAEINLRNAYKELEKTHKELKEMQSQMVQSEKMASIGALAAGVAHEINTPVGFVASNFETLNNYIRKFCELITMYEDITGKIDTLDKVELKSKTALICETRQNMHIDFILEDIEELLSDSKEGLERVTNIVQNLRDFSRIDQAEDFDEHDLNSGIEATLAVARNEIKYDCNIQTDFSQVPTIFCNSGQINQVFLNILVNAAQAIKTVEREDKCNITIKTYATEEEVVCEITDDGPGIPPDSLSKIFDPFFTTKPAGKGTGLGLSVSYDIVVNKHKGELLVDSTVGKGTKFTIKLPIERSKQNSEKETPANGEETDFNR